MIKHNLIPSETTYPRAKEKPSQNADLKKDNKDHQLQIFGENKAPKNEDISSYTIKKNDTLSQIVKKFYANSSEEERLKKEKEIQELNHIKNKNLIYAGQKLTIPEFFTNDNNSKLKNKTEVPPETQPEKTAPTKTQKSPDFTLSSNHHKIILDPGHGGKDPGAVVNGFKESDYNIDIAKRTAQLLQEQGVEVEFTDPKQNKYGRRDFRDQTNADAYVSIHSDVTSNRSKSGISTYYNTPESKSLAGNMTNSFKRAFSNKPVSEKTANYVVIKDEKKDGVNTPSVLVETGFMSNPKEFNEMRTEAGKQKRAEAIAKGILSSLQEKEIQIAQK